VARRAFPPARGRGEIPPSSTQPASRVPRLKIMRTIFSVFSKRQVATRERFRRDTARITKRPQIVARHPRHRDFAAAVSRCPFSAAPSASKHWPHSGIPRPPCGPRRCVLAPATWSGRHGQMVSRYSICGPQLFGVGSAVQRPVHMEPSWRVSDFGTLCITSPPGLIDRAIGAKIALEQASASLLHRPLGCSIRGRITSLD